MVKKVRFIEPGNRSPYKKSIRNFFTYNRSIRNPSTGLITLATIVKKIIDDTLMYSESISEINFEDIYDSDIVGISINTYNSLRGYAIARKIRKRSRALIIFGGMHASLYYTEAMEYGDYVLTGDGDESIVDFIHAVDNNTAIDFPGVIYKKNGNIINTGKRKQPENIDTIPDRDLVYNYSRLAKRYDTLWPQVHASRGCIHNCAYCAVILHFGRKIRKRTPGNVVADIKEAINFHKRNVFPRLNTALWITDDNFAQDREWAIAVLKEMIHHNIKYHFSIQARFEIGFDNEILVLMKKAGFFEVSLGIEFLDDDSFKQYNKKSSYSEIVRSIKNIQDHGIGVRGLFIVGSDHHNKGIGEKIAQFVIDNKIHGVLIQSLFFTPGTPFFNSHKDILIHQNWDKYDGNVVHFPKKMKPYELQEEIIYASKKIYSIKRLLHAVFHYKWIKKILFIGEFFWHCNIRRELKKELPYLKNQTSLKFKNLAGER
ncbi:MAG: B12-binding domain-containing radical SAM protein [Spirochaetales bacterium]|nr:B12-binding domain-containing radical SAM protein [Spirochaetales bacterium]